MQLTEKDLTDNRGNEIKIGSKVAFNHSGELATGTVLDIRAATRYNRIEPRFKILRSCKLYKDNISEVTNPKNIMVIFEPEGY